MRWIPLLLAAVLAACSADARRFDTDGDGSVDSPDCAAADPAIHPGADDPYGDGVDQDCDGWDGIDRGGDGYPASPELSGEPMFDCSDG